MRSTISLKAGRWPAGSNDTGAGFHVIHEVRAEDAHLESGEARVLQAAGIDGLVFDGHLRLIHWARPDRGDVDRDAGFGTAQQPKDGLANDPADRIPQRLFQHAW